MRSTLFCIAILTFSSGLAQADEPADPTLLGAAVMVRPSYDGSDSSDLQIIPVLQYTKGMWFARTTEGILEAGIKSSISEALSMGLQVAYEADRNRRDSDFLNRHHVPNLDVSASLGAFMQYEKVLASVPFDLVARYRKDVDTARGDQFDLRLTAGVYGGEGKKFNAEIFAQTTWASRKAMQSVYGVSDPAVIGSGLAAFNPSGGNVTNQVGIWASYNLNPHWLLLANLERHQLAGDAKNSPLTEVHANHYFSLGAAYQF